MAKRIGKFKVTKEMSAISLADGGTATSKVSLAGGHLKTVKLNGGATVTLTAADSGATCVFDTAGASKFVLPAPELGMYFTFISAITATAADQCDSFSTATDGNNDFITLNGSTTGGVAGSIIHCAAILGTSAAKTWVVSGNQIATGAMATPFADSQI